jgi:hypothetical protein
VSEEPQALETDPTKLGVGPKCPVKGCWNSRREDLPVCQGCALAALERWRAKRKIEERTNVLGIIGIALFVMLVVPAGCGVMVGSFVWAARAVAGWP